MTHGKNGIERLKFLHSRGQAMLSNRPFKKGQEEIWTEQCEDAVRSIFGPESSYVGMLTPQTRVIVAGYYSDSSIAKRVQQVCEVLESFIETLASDRPMSDAPEHADEHSFWDDIHPEIREIARSRYESSHFADAVEASLKHVEVVVKKIFVAAGKPELIGAALMKSAFSPNGGVIILEDLSTQDGKNIQQGYMEMMAGAMTGIRNPKAHGNIVIDAKRARHHLYTASLFLYVIDERK